MNSKFAAGVATIAASLTIAFGPANAQTKATGTPLTIGVVAPTQGSAAYPDAAYGAQAAQHYINNNLNGVNGRPIQLDICGGDGSPEKQINCANGFVTSKVPVVIDAYEPAVGAAVPILVAAKIPLVGTLTGTGTADKQPYGNTFYFTGPTEVSALGAMSALKSLGKKTAVLALTDAPASHVYINTLVQPLAKKLGIDLTVLFVPGSGANWTVVAATEIASSPDAVGVVALPDDSCTALYKAVRQAGYKGTFFAGSCSKFVGELKGAAAGAIVVPRLWVFATRPNAPAKVQAELDIFKASMEATGRGDQLTTRALWAFAGTINTVKAMQRIKGEVTSAAVVAALQSLVNEPSFAGPLITCDGKQWPGIASACTRQTLFLEVQSDGSLKSTSPGGYVELDTSAFNK
ncbi:MAG: hypothetical protein EBY24_07620 [Betaproteobacteria bacterium]|nr:hypothetical protein [Betaproteobacteria bacterium]